MREICLFCFDATGNRVIIAGGGFAEAGGPEVAQTARHPEARKIVPPDRCTRETHHVW